MPRPQPVPSHQICQSWKEVYARAGATAAEMIDVVSSLGPAEVSLSKMCISLLRAQDANTAMPDYLGAGRKRAGASSSSLSSRVMEAVQIAGPSGVFEEWKVGVPQWWW